MNCVPAPLISDIRIWGVFEYHIIIDWLVSCSLCISLAINLETKKRMGAGGHNSTASHSQCRYMQISLSIVEV